MAQTTDVPEPATDGLILPKLGNTPETDRILLREIGDTYVYDPNAMSDENSELASTMESDASQDSNPEAINPLNAWETIQQSRRIQIPENERINKYRRDYHKEAIWVTKILNRATPFIGHIVDALDARYLPAELALLPAIESGYRPEVKSSQYAAGIWQFVPKTAEEIGIKRSVWFDGRADIRQSTTAAMDYLSYLNAEFHGDWLLTLAAYNAGPGRVRAAVKSNQKADKPTDFWSLKLPPETYNYVPKFLALLAMVRYDSMQDFVIPDVARGDGFEIVDLERRASIDKLAAVTGIDETVLRNLNAGLVHGVTPPKGPHVFYVWKGLGDVLRTRVDEAKQGELLTLPATHTVVAGDTISGIAQLYKISQRRLRSMNALETSKILIGQELAVRRNATFNESSIEYVVSIGDTLSEIADKHSVRVKNIRNADGEALSSDLIHPGVKLLINIEE
ncbi:MAG: transglycosylase SLT domain-containing protein [Granulosicoccus sp.]